MSTVKTSQASMLAAWPRMDSRQEDGELVTEDHDLELLHSSEWQARGTN